MNLLEELTNLIDQGYGFPDAIFEVVWRYKLSNDEYDKLISEYDG